MNDAQPAPAASLLPDSTDLFTIMVFVLIALFAVAMVALIVVGARRKRRRVAAAQVVQERIDQAEDEGPKDEQAAEDDRVIAAPTTPAARTERPAPAPVVSPAPLADEPVAAVAPGGANPAAEAIPGASVDDPALGPVTQLKGLGPKVAARLAELGITSVGDLARLPDDEAARADADLGAFAGRMARDRWVEQARLLAAGDRAGFEAVFGKL